MSDDRSLREWEEIARLLTKLDRVWNDAGPVPSYHRRQVEQLREQWPLLHDTVASLVATRRHQK